MRKPAVVLCVAAILLLACRPGPANAQECQIELTADPAVVNFPSQLPAPGGPTFGELLYANYSRAYEGRLVVVQYLSGSDWVYLLNFTANSLGYTVAPAGLNSGWARTGENTLRAVVGSCASSPAAFSVRVDDTALVADLGTYVLLALAGVAFFFVGKWARFGLFFVVAAGVYLALAPFTGQRYDVFFLLSSGIRVLEGVNPFSAGNPPVYPEPLKWAYPPLYAVYSALAYLVYQGFTGASVPTVGSMNWPGFLTSAYDVWQAFVPATLPVLVFLLKLPMIASAFATGLLLQRMTGRKSAAVAWLVNPLVILVTAVWGQLDPIAVFFAVASVYYYRKEKPYHAFFLASVGAAVKVWPALLIPLFFAARLKRDGRKAVRPIAAVLPAVAASVGLYAAFGSLLETLFVFVYARGFPTYAGQFSVNGLTWQQVLVVLGSPPVPLFLILGIPAYLLILVHVYRKQDEDVTKWMVVSILVLFLTYNYVNPQYFYWIIPFLMLRGRRLAVWAFTALPLIYIALSYNIFYFVSPTLLFSEFSIGASIVEQLKLAAFYQMPRLYLGLSAIVPTVVYILLLGRELAGRKPGAAGKPQPVHPAGPPGRD